MEYDADQILARRTYDLFTNQALTPESPGSPTGFVLRAVNDLIGRSFGGAGRKGLTFDDSNLYPFAAARANLLILSRIGGFRTWCQSFAHFLTPLTNNKRSTRTRMLLGIRSPIDLPPSD
jgi:hypothetical protein